LLDTGGISDAYNAKLVLPTIYILGPALKVVDYFQGGGKHIEIMFVKLAEKQLRRARPEVAVALAKTAESGGSDNAEAKVVQAKAAIEENRFDQAEAIYNDLKQKKGDGEILALEGLTEVYAKKGDEEKALETVAALKKKAPDRVQAFRTEGDILYRRNKKKAAETAYKTAVAKNEGTPAQKAEARNQLGRFYASLGDYDKASGLYEQAVDIDPFFIEATSNKGVASEKTGDWSNALKSYQQVLAVNKNDSFASVLAAKAQEMLDLQKDKQRSERIDRLVKDLAARFREGKSGAAAAPDTWTSRPMILTFVDFTEKGGLAERDGLSTVMTVQLGEKLNESGRVQVVERVLLERLLEELNLGSSELADPETALRLGKVLAAKLIGTGSIFYTPNGSLLNMRLIDTETTAVPKVLNKQFVSMISMDKELNELNREILKTIIQKYPLQGYVVQADGDRILVNLGSKQGVILGTRFEVLGTPGTIEYKGKILKGTAKPVAEIEITEVQDDFSYGRIVQKDKPPERDDKVREKVDKQVS
jgi:tetratricopeptide (TPR) repeat protein